MLVDAGIGETKVVVFNSKENSGDLYLRGPQSKGVVNGQIKFFDDVKINKPSQDFLLSLLDNYIEKESVERIKLR
jgi:ABC-type phosphate transport system substrate-binding protein